MSSFLPHLYRLQEHTFQQMVWDRNELILGTWKKYSNFIKNIKKTHIVNNKNPKNPKPFHLSPPQKKWYEIKT